MTNTAAAHKVFKVLGTTDEVTECEHCGRVDLKGTIRLGILDEDGYTAECPLCPEICRRERRGCIAHGDAPRKVYTD